MGKIIELNNNHYKSDNLRKIEEESSKEDLDEKKRKNKRLEKWDSLLYISAIFFLIYFIFVLLGIVSISSNLPSLIATWLIPLIISIFQIVSKRNTS
ncbi:MAG: hypothetical protein U0W65_16410 [Bacteroidia bacterium]